MTLILDNAVVNTDHYGYIYVVDGKLCLGNSVSVIMIDNIPENALQQIAVAKAEGKSYLEFDEAVLLLEDNNDA